MAGYLEKKTVQLRSLKHDRTPDIHPSENSHVYASRAEGVPAGDLRGC
jgi:hypothetical protein